MLLIFFLIKETLRNINNFYFLVALEQCYQCDTEEDGQKGCVDPVNISDLKSVKCSELDYESSTRSGMLLKKLRSINPSNLNQTYKYGCIKVAVKKNGELQYARSCVRTAEEIHNDCDLLKTKLDEDSTINCNICIDDDNCNSGFQMVYSACLLFVCLFITFQRNF